MAVRLIGERYGDRRPAQIRAANELVVAYWEGNHARDS